MSLRRRLALLICPELRPLKTFDLDALRERQEARRAAHPCLMEAHGPGRHNAYCVRCGEYVSAALPEVCPARAPTREVLGLEPVQFFDVEAARRNHREFKASRLSQRVDHVDDVFDGKGRKRVFAVRLLLLAQKLQHYVIGVSAGADAVHRADEKDNGHA